MMITNCHYHPQFQVSRTMPYPSRLAYQSQSLRSALNASSSPVWEDALSDLGGHKVVDNERGGNQARYQPSESQQSVTTE